MTFAEVEYICDGIAYLEQDGKLYKYCSTAADAIRELKVRVFENIETGEEIGFTYQELRNKSDLKMRMI